MDFVGKTKAQVLFVGLVTGLLILWLSASFMHSAYRQHSDANRIQKISSLEQELSMLAQELVGSRLAISQAFVAASQPAEQLTPISIDLAEEQKTQSDSATFDRYDTVLKKVKDLIADKALTDYLKYSMSALYLGRDKLAKTIPQLESLNGQLVAHLNGEPRSDFASVLDQYQQLSEEIVALTQELQTGIHYVSSRDDKSIAELLQFQTTLQAWNDTVSTDTTLLVLKSAPNTLFQSNLKSVLRSENLVALRTNQLRNLQNTQRVDSKFFNALNTLVNRHRNEHSKLRGQIVSDYLNGMPETDNQLEWLNSGTGIHDAVVKLQSSINDEVNSRVAGLKFSALRNLIINTFLILASIGAAIISGRLLKNIHSQAYHDRLTQLPNRFRFNQYIDKVCSSRTPTTIVMLDIDNLKSINDTIGHAMSDELICEMISRWRCCLGPEDTLATFGGDDFAALLHSCQTESDATRRIERMISAASKPFDIHGASVTTSVSAGMCLYPEHADNPDDLQINCQMALVQAKDEGKNRLRVFNQEVANRYKARIQMEVDLRAAVRKNQLILHYQPKVCVETGQVHGVEALVRWNHPELGLVPPFKFIPLAESCGLIVPIGTWVLREACRQTAQWRAEGLTGLHVAVNVSAGQFVDDSFVDLVHSALSDHNLDPSCLELEVTESVGMMDLDIVVDRLTILRASNIRIAIDDFGTDYSSLQYLSDLPLDNLKIDRAFVRKLDEGDQGIAKTIVLLARSFNLTTVAEGVETIEQLDKVTALGCDYIQGYYYSKPVPAEEMQLTINRVQAMQHQETNLTLRTGTDG